MQFETCHIENFLSIFDAHKMEIRSFKGCKFLELYQDEKHPNVFFTYSYWSTSVHLEQYRNSKLFKTVWSKTKLLFNAKPEAWSVTKIDTLH